MPKKLTYEFVKSKFNKKGYKLLTKNYVNARTKLTYICGNNHKHSITWDNFIHNIGCAHCSGKSKPHIDLVKETFAFNNYVLLSTKYVNASTKLKYICDKGHKGTIAWAEWQRGQRCLKCFHKGMLGQGNPNWVDGRSGKDYCPIWKDKEYKESIKERDAYICQNPYCYGVIYNRALSIHHIDYDKKNCKPNNLITLCLGCNTRANKDKEWHQEWYQNIMFKKYGYNYE